MNLQVENFITMKNKMLDILTESYNSNLDYLLEKYIKFKRETPLFFKYNKKHIEIHNFEDITIEIEFCIASGIINNKEYIEGNILNITVKKERVLLNVLSVNKEIYFESKKMHYTYSPLLEYWNINLEISDNFYNRATLINNQGLYQIHLVKENSDGSTYKCILTEEHIFELEYFKHKKEIIGEKVKNYYLDNKIPKLR